MTNRAANRPAFIARDDELSWTEADERVDSYACGLRQLGLNSRNGHPARVAIALPNCIEFVVSYFAALRAGLVAVPLNPAYTGRELHQLLADSAADAIVATSEVLDALDGFGAWPPHLAHAFRVGGTHAARPLADLVVRGEPVQPTTGDEDLAVLLFTSGTEGRPKGAMLSHRALLANHAQLAAIDPPPVRPDDVVLLAVPLFHAYGLNSALGAVAFHGATGVLVDPTDPVDAMRQVVARQVSALIGVPTMFAGWADAADSAALAAVRVAVSGAAPLESATAARFEAVWGRPIAIGYGLTETAPVVTTTLAGPVAKQGSIGRAIPGVDVRLVSASGTDVWRSDESSGGEVVDDFDDDASGTPGTDPGEIVVRGANLFSGYWPNADGGPDRDGWWATGDVAYADADGDLFLVDRIRQLILVNGFNVYPAEVERVLAMHPAVGEAAVVGVPHAPSGQTVKAYVVAPAPVSETDLAAHCARNLARFKCPTEYEFVAELPHSATGKVRKAALRDVEAMAPGGADHG
jgi:long-chain acyl-CoA synthetase